ncbi:MAG: SDR family oxidoreductase [Deltaproteobacteria bacterium]
MEIANKIVVVTGGGSGIGRSLVERFHAEGAQHIVVADLDGAAAAEVAGLVGGTGVKVDVANEEGIRDLVATTERDQGPIDLFVSNAGFVTIGGLEAPVEDLQKMFGVHVLAHLYAARAVIPGMAERGHGYLLNTASAAGLLSQFGSLHYALTKHAAIALAEWIAITHGHQGIKVSVLCPQAVATNIVPNSPDRAIMEGGGADVASADGVMQPGEVADVVMEALREERFHVLPHAEVREYVKQKGADVDRWIQGMQRWQERLFPAGADPATWLTGK